MARALVTAFGPFPGAPRNATAEIVRGLEVPGVEVFTMVLPVVWWRAPALALSRARALAPDVIVMNGVARPRQPLLVERGGSDRRGDALDAAGRAAGPWTCALASPTTIAHARVARVARAAIARLGGVLERGERLDAILTGARVAPVRASNQYLCNQLTFEVARAGVAQRVAFLHWPSALEGAHVDAARAVLAASIAASMG